MNKKEIINWLLAIEIEEFNVDREEIEVWGNISYDKCMELAKMGFFLENDRFKIKLDSQDTSSTLSAPSETKSEPKEEKEGVTTK